ncbi:N-6 DNA methylase [[Ruminococcus] gnavus]|nr:N-6 DNA methylase [Mediterraneibacter gnavus]MCB5682648.1 N-6 DNA methylase [Mediterraneibacter gnavus]
MRIYEQFEKSLSAKENADFLKNEYGWGGSYPVIIGAGIDESHDGKGITITKGIGKENPHITLSWSQVEKRIGELIRMDRYLNPKEKERYPQWLESQEERRAKIEETKRNREILSNAPPEQELAEKEPEEAEISQDVKYEYHLGDKVYIGASEYEILSVDDERVMLYDYDMPLFNKEFSRTEFDRKVRENPMNEHLIVKEEPAEERNETEEVQTNMGSMPIEDYREIVASQSGFDSYDEMYHQGYRIGNGYDKEPEPVVPAWEQKKKVKGFDLHPDVSMAERHTFNLKENEVETVGKKERFRRNIMAIQLLKKCQEENRFATLEEQIILSKYVGWGGLSEAFDENNSAWATEYLELSSVLTPEEYASARESTLTAFYTPPEVITAIYKAMEQMGFKEGNLLEPSCGIGNFIGMLPDTMQDSKIYGVELDTISAGIAQQLYQKTTIAAQGFEETNLPDSFFDGVVGNVPFGDFKVSDKRYDKHKFLIHDYFFAKSLDKLRPGGVMALVTSKGTMDKETLAVRKYIAQRAELLGAIRLPNNTFKGNAGTEVISDILILQKRDRLIDIEPDWVHLDTDENGIKMNSYFVQHPEMILGEMKMVSGRFGMEATCVPYENADLAAQLDEAVANIHGEITEYEAEEELEEEDNSIPADPAVRNFSYTVVDDKIYYRENSRMTPVEVSATAENRIKGMIAIRNSVRTLIELQTEDYPDSEIKAEQERLNRLYDTFSGKYGLINSRANTSAFSQDSSFSLLSALEIIGEDGELERKADMFSKRTIKPHTPVTSVDTASEALAVSLGEKATIDMDYMMELSGKSENEIFEDLKGVIFLNPLYEYGNSYEPKYLMADEYLSGNVREKLKIAKNSAELYPEDYKVNVEALQKVQPKDLTASEISVRLGATWLPPDDVQEFIFHLLETPRYAQWNIKVHFSPFTSEWNIEGKSYDKGNVRAYNTYGTSRINAYKIIEETLNLKDVRIFDYIEDDEGKKKAVLNKKETAIAQSKQEMIKQEFQDWIWSDPERRERLCKSYNEKFNSVRPREYDGSHIIFNGMNPEIELREHQKNAVAHILYGGNTLLAHAVGAGKTFEMVAAAQESKRLGLCNKSLFVVPNHLTEQWAAEYLQLYPAANILVATKKDFETKNRKRFCGRIATGDYDAVIIGHSQFEKIPMSIERQRAILEQQLEEITGGIAELKRNRGENFSIKQLEKSKKSIKQKLDKLNDQTKKDDVVTFEELGVDRLFVDESHYYKNLYLYTKMRNVGGIAQTEAQKSSDLFMKCRYLDEITGGRGTVFATGTPISNSMVELYTIQRYLQYNTLVKNGLQHFDAWASTFGETITAVELTPEGYTLIGQKN